MATASVACGKRDPAPDPLKGARESLEKARKVEGIVGGAADAARKSDEEQTK